MRWLTAFALSITLVLSGILVSADDTRAVETVAPAVPPAAADWKEVQEIKKRYVSLTAQHAMEQQKMTEAAPVALEFPADIVAEGNLKITSKSPRSLSVDVTASPKAYNQPAAELIRIGLSQPMDLVSKHSGLAVFVKTEEGSSPEVRLGVRLLAAGGKKVEVQPIVPAVSRWGDASHEVYFDWAFLDYPGTTLSGRTDGSGAAEAAAVLKAIDTIEITVAAARRAPERGASAEARRGRFTLTDLRLVDYLKGSYDPSRQGLRFDPTAGRWVPSGRWDLTLQHRCQEVTGIVAAYGGAPGVQSAIASLDHAVRTQCWDGSFLDGRRGAVTVASGEYTFGFTIYGLLTGYQTLERAKYPALDEKIRIGAEQLTRREAYQRMFYRAAMARAGIATPKDYRDDIIGGNTLITGANRVLGYAIAMRMVAEVIRDPARKQEILDKYRPFMREIAEAQGKFSGGFPILGEGDAYQGQGIHYDAGYTRTHMDWLVLGVRQTGDPLLVEILRKYQDVFVAAMDETGTGIQAMISERGRGRGSVRLILPDVTAQVGMEYKLPIIAQWGYNCGILAWSQSQSGPGGHFASASRSRGYSLGAHTSILVEDMVAEPRPKDLGYLFPRQMPIWTTRLFDKKGQLLRTSKMEILPSGASTSDYTIGAGEVPATVGVPVRVKTPQGKVTAVAEKLSGWPKLLPPDAAVEIAGDVTAKGRVDQPIKLTLVQETKLVITGPEIALPPEAGGGKVPFRAELTLTPEKPGQEIELTVVRRARQPAVQ